MAGFKWNTGKLYYSTVELGNQQILHYTSTSMEAYVMYHVVSEEQKSKRQETRMKIKPTTNNITYNMQHKLTT
jgi:hypothetical protein